MSEIPIPPLASKRWHRPNWVRRINETQQRERNIWLCNSNVVLDAKRVWRFYLFDRFDGYDVGSKHLRYCLQRRRQWIDDQRERLSRERRRLYEAWIERYGANGSQPTCTLAGGVIALSLLPVTLFSEMEEVPLW